MRGLLVPTTIITLLFSALPVPAVGHPETPTGVVILGAGMVDGHSVRVDIGAPDAGATPGDTREIELDAWPGGVHAHGSVPLVGLPPRLPIPMDVDLAGGAVKVGAVKVGEFPPVPRFTENVRFPVRVTLRQGGRVTTAERTVTLLLPTVIVAGYANELSGRDGGVLGVLKQHGYRDNGRAPTLFWFDYPSHELTLEQAAHALAGHVNGTVLPRTYAAKINVVGYSLGGLMARWNVQFDVDGWGTLVNRLLLVGVPNEGSVLPYMYRDVPTYVPYGYLVHSPAVREMLPTFPFWRRSSTDAWSTPPDAGNPVLAELNNRPMPAGVQVELYYGSGQQTVTGLTEDGAATLGPGDGIVPAASALGGPIQGGSGVPALLAPNVVRIDLGTVGHTSLMSAGVTERFAAALLRQFDTTAAPPPQRPQGQ